MRLHVVLPNEAPDTGADLVVAAARAAERLGYDGVYISDHLLPPAPFGEGPYAGTYESLAVLAYVAAVTDRIRLGTSVIVVGLRDPVLLAKQVATIDRLSGGRMTLGIGLGWDAEQFANLHAPFAGRAARADEALSLIRQLWRTGEGPFDGEHHGFEKGWFVPRPTDGVRILVGGTSAGALRRAAAVADIWQSPPIDPAGFSAMAATVRSAAGRPIEVGGRLGWDDPATPVADVLVQVRAWAEAGADQLAVSFGPVEGHHDRMAALASAWPHT